MRLPQRIGTPPTTHVLVDDRHEVHRLTRGLAEGDEERDISGVEDDVAGVRVLRRERLDGRVRALEHRIVVEQRRDRAAVHGMQAGLGALQHLAETLPPRHVQPRADMRIGDGIAQVAAAIEIGRAIGTDGELEIAGQPLLVGHLGDVTEIRLRSDVEGGDDLVAACGHSVGVAGDLVEETARTRRSVVDLVDIGTELATARRHTAVRGTRADPVGCTGRVDEQLLDLGSRGGLEGRHRGGTDEDAVERHRREAVFGRPTARKVIGGLLRCADTTTDAQHQIRAGAQLGVGVEEQIVQVFPRVVTTGAATLDVTMIG